jgi:hypothetical protein
MLTMEPYKRPAVATTLRILGLVCFGAAGAVVVSQFVLGPSSQTSVGPSILAGLGLFSASALIDYAARAAYHAERAADSLLRMEWVRQHAADEAEAARKKAELDALEAEARRLDVNE